jgi:hypothetical protein
VLTADSAQAAGVKWAEVGVEAIETELGTDPSGSAATVKARLDGIEDGSRIGSVAMLKSLIDAKGDLLVGTGADAVGRLAAGSLNTVLQADPGQASGLKWGSTLTDVALTATGLDPVMSPNLAPALGSWTPSGGASWSDPTMTMPAGSVISANVPVTSGQIVQFDLTGTKAGEVTVTVGAANLTCPAWQIPTVIAEGTGTLPVTVSFSSASTLTAITARTATPGNPVSLAGMQVRRPGSNNIGVGVDALYSNTTGYYNIGVGASALRGNTTGYSNIGVGASALYSNTTGYSNIGVGASALRGNTTGSNNIGVGASALRGNTTGDYNIGVGVDALYSNTTGYYNIGVGASALYSNTTGYSNIGVGVSALYSNTTGYSNIGVGVDALRDNTTGYSNIGVGASALRGNTTGSERTALGRAAGSNGTDINGTVAVGYSAQATADDAIAIGRNASTAIANHAQIGGPSHSLSCGNPGAGAGRWQFGIKRAGAVTLDAANYIEVSINGTVHKLLVAT